MSELLIVMVALIVALPRMIGAAMPYLPATIWALRVPKESPHNRCPPMPDGRPAMPALFKRRER